MLDIIVPLILRSHHDELAGYFECVHQEYVDYFCERVRYYGNRYLATEACQEFKGPYLAAK